jgi:hypothetical protein
MLFCQETSCSKLASLVMVGSSKVGVVLLEGVADAEKNDLFLRSD